MYKFGKIPPRTLKSFGVAGLLGEKCQVFYGSIFNTQHLGQISDLLSAHIRKLGFDELELRAVVLFGVFEAYRSQSRSNEDPLVIECGVDEEKLAIGVSFRTEDAADLGIESLDERIGNPTNPFDRLLKEIHSYAHRMVVRIQPKENRIEIVSLLGLSGKIDISEIQQKAKIEAVVLEEGESDTNDAASYVELGDLDYSKILSDEPLEGTLESPPSGEVISKASLELEEAIRVRAQKAAVAKDVIRISGVTDQQKDEVIRIKGGESSLTDNTKITVSSSNRISNNPEVAAYQRKVEELQSRIQQLEGGSQEETAEEEPGSGSGLRGLFGKVLSFGKHEQHLESEEEGETSEQEAVEEGDAEVKDETPTDLEQALSKPSETAAAADSLIVEIEAGSFERTLNKAKEESLEIKKEVSNARAKRWMDGLMSDLVAEKSRLHDIAKKLNLSIRQKEIEFRNREHALVEELRRKEEMLRQKSNALSRAKEQLNHATANMEKFRTVAQSTGDEGHFKQKFEMTKRLLATTKEENTILVGKVDELKTQLASHQLAQKRGNANRGELSTLIAQNERMQKQVEEFKKANQQLMDKFEKLKRERAGPDKSGADELKKRLEAAMKVISAHKKDAEQLQQKIDSLQREEIRLKMELNKSQMQLKARGGGGPKAA